jgi:hypothetical protein
MLAEGVEGAEVFGEQLQSTFGGDGVSDTMSKPMRSKRKRNHAFDDFYQFQVARKWTRNAENFLSRGKASKTLFQEQQKKRNIKRL